MVTSTLPPLVVRQTRAPLWLRRLTLLALIALLMLFLAYANSSFNGYRIQLVNLVAINGIIAVSLTLTSGFTGVFSLGQIGFAAIGAYVGTFINLAPTWKSAMFMPALPHSIATLDTTGWPHPLALLVACLAGGLVAAIVGAIVGLPLMRLSGHYVAVATMGFLIIVQAVAVNWTELTQGAPGIGSVPNYTTVWAAYIWLLVTISIAWRLRTSIFGRDMISSREDLIAARAIGVNVLRSRLIAFVVGAFFTGAAGALLAHQIGTVAPNAYYFTMTFTVVIMVVLGGLGSISGAVFGAAILTLAPEYLRDIEDGISLGPVSIGAHYGLTNILLAVGFIMIMIFRRQGIFGDHEIGLGWLDWLFRRSRMRNEEGVTALPRDVPESVEVEAETEN